MRSSIILLAMIVILSTGIVGCKKHTSTKVNPNSTTEWIWTGHLIHETEEENHSWYSTLDGVIRVEVKGDDFIGRVRIRIYDAVGSEIYDEVWQRGWADTFRISDFSHPATAGNWHIRIDFDNASGYLRVIVDGNT